MTEPAILACIGWGSLIWDPRTLPTKGEWLRDGPLLPLEFARQSSDGRITLVLAPSAALVATYWVHILADTIASARIALAEREGITDARGVGTWSRGKETATLEVKSIRTWAIARHLGGVVWTRLKPGFRSRRGRLPTADEIVAYLQSLPPETRRRAEEYIRKAPPEIDTPYRRRIQAELGWTPVSRNEPSNSWVAPPAPSR